MALTTDFSGTYDYEFEEGKHSAVNYVNDLQDGYYTEEQLREALDHELAHWTKALDNSGGLNDFVRGFNSVSEYHGFKIR